MEKKILFVCTGNICRSPMAEGIFKKLALVRPDLVCRSAGIIAYNGFPASPNGVAVAKKYGVDLSYHLSQLLSRELLDDSDYVFVMTEEHMRALTETFPEYMYKVFLLKHFAEDSESWSNPNIDDPIGGSEHEYERCYLELEDAIKKIVSKL
ncbi:low molecular weight protein arginine phosphatase [bacterium]|nr:low molecular weight protein arginine phosphatase [bacterium]MCP5462563.1 low molecular weight protein arginine phosphatase [bacterium]